MKRLFDWTIAMAGHRRALAVLALVSFAESSFFPVPPDVLMIPMILARPDRAWTIAAVALAASVLGGLFGYAIGAFAYEQIGRPLLAGLGQAEAMEAFRGRFNDYGFWAVLFAGLTPFPYKVITIMSGWTGMPLLTFVATSVIARGLRFFVLAALLRWFGDAGRRLIERHLGLAATAFVVLLLGGFLMVGYSWR